MQRKIPATYVYNSKTNEFKVYTDLIRELVDFSHKFDGTDYHIYGRTKNRNFRVEIAKHAGDVFHNRVTHEYVVYFNNPDKRKAINAIYDYILSRVEIEINYIENHLSKLQDERTKLIEFYDREIEAIKQD